MISKFLCRSFWGVFFEKQEQVLCDTRTVCTLDAILHIEIDAPKIPLGYGTFLASALGSSEFGNKMKRGHTVWLHGQGRPHFPPTPIILSPRTNTFPIRPFLLCTAENIVPRTLSWSSSLCPLSQKKKKNKNKSPTRPPHSRVSIITGRVTRTRPCHHRRHDLELLDACRVS